jgi:tetratricopeptide (TPR) repeat protein
MEVNMSDFEFWKDLGNIFDAILNYQKKNVEFNNRFINPWIRLGNIFDRDDQHKEAVQAYKHAIELDPDNSSNWSDLGDVLFKMGSFDDAAAVYQKAAELDPKAGWPVCNLGQTLASQGKYEQAIPLYLDSIELFADDKDKAVAWNRLGNAYRKLNDYQNAFLAFQNADALDSDNTGFHDQLDETTETNTMLAPEEVLEQMSSEVAIDQTDLAMEEGIDEAIVQTSLPEAEAITDITETVIALDEPEEILAIAPNMEMVVEETPAGITEEPVAEPVEEPVAQVIEEVVAWSKAKAAEEETSVEVNVEVKTEDEAVKVEVQVMQTTAEEAPVVEAVAEKTVVEETAKLPALEASEPVAVEEVNEAAPVEEVTTEETQPEEVESEDEPLPSWITEETTETEQEEIVVEEPVVNQHTEVSVQVTTNIAGTSTEVVETYTELISTNYTLEDTQPMKAVRVETKFESTEQEADVEAGAPQLEIEEEASEITQKSTAVNVEVETETAAPTTEAPYEEYLKDAIEPALSDHLEDVHAAAPVTRVSESGDVRIAMDTENAHVWNELGNVYFNSGACDDAIAAYGKAIELDRQFAWPYSNLALAYVQKNRFAEAILLYQRSIELFSADKDKAVTWNRLGNVYRRLNDYSNAIAAYQTADELDPDNATLSLRSHYGLLGNLYLDQQKTNYVS